MNPEQKFHSIVISVTTALVFLVWLGLNQVITKYPFFAVVLSGLISLGIYRALGVLLLSLLRHVKTVKQFMLGPQYMQGSWAGFFVGHNDRIRFFVETFEQDLSRTVIRGRVFRDDGSFHGSWIAEDASIDPVRGKLTYHYRADAIGNTFINPGIADFDLQRPAQHRPPVGLIGFSSDLFAPQKLMAFEDKVSEENLLDSSDGLAKAREVYEKYKSLVLPLMCQQSPASDSGVAADGHTGIGCRSNVGHDKKIL